MVDTARGFEKESPRCLMMSQENALCIRQPVQEQTLAWQDFQTNIHYPDFILLEAWGKVLIDWNFFDFIGVMMSKQ